MKTELILMRALFVATALLLGGVLVAMLVPPPASAQIIALGTVSSGAPGLPQLNRPSKGAREARSPDNAGMLHVVLHRPEIPPNTGNVIRLCANSGAALHLVRPLGFELDDARLRRAGLDYHEYARVTVHADWTACRAALGEARIFAFTKQATRTYSDVRFSAGDVLLFGCETAGLPAEVLRDIADAHRLRLPMRPHSRSLNLSNAVAVSVYEAWRQLDYDGAA